MSFGHGPFGHNLEGFGHDDEILIKVKGIFVKAYKATLLSNKPGIPNGYKAIKELLTDTNKSLFVKAYKAVLYLNKPMIPKGYKATEL